MTVEPSSIELEEFELVQAASDTVLLRVTARAPAATPAEPTLLVRYGGHVHRVRPLPSPPDPEGWLRVAYSLRAEVLDRAPTFTLELWPGAFLELPEGLARGEPTLRHRPEVDAWVTDAVDEPSPDTESLFELEAAVIEANRTATALQAEAQQLAARAREAEDALQAVREQNEDLLAERAGLIEEAGRFRETAAPESFVLEAADRAWEGIQASLASLRLQIDRDLGRLDEELKAARAETAAAWEAERAARADAERLRAESVEEDPERVIELIRDAAEDRVRSQVETEIRAARQAQIDEG